MTDLQKLYKGWVTHVTDPGSFWMQIGTDNGFDEFKVYQANIDEYINSTSDSLVVAASALSQGDCVVVKNRSDRRKHRWRRARVSRVEGDCVDVFFVDHGYTEIINIQDIRTIQSPVFEYLSPQAIRVELAGIKPLTRSWTSRAISMFEKKVLDKSLIVSVLEVDESQSLFVALYRRGDNGDWFSVTHSMLEEDLGLPNDYSICFEKCISHEVVERVLLRMNQEESVETTGEVETSPDAGEEDDDDGTWQDKPKDGEEDIEIWDDSVKRQDNKDIDSVWENAIEGLEESSSEDETTEASDNTNKSNSVSGYTEAQCASSQFLEPENDKENQDLMDPDSVTCSSQEFTKTVGIPQFDIKPLYQTRTVSANDLQVEVEERIQRKRVKDLQKDLQECEEDLDEGSMLPTTIHWGRSDSQVCQPHTADVSDLHESISTELNYRFYSEMNEMEALQKMLKCYDIKDKAAQPFKPTIPKPTVKPNQTCVSQHEPGSSIEESNLQPLNEEKSYYLEKKIVEILMNTKNNTPEMLRVQLHEIIPADKTLKPDRMAVVMTAVLESIVHHKCYDPAFALTILETYTGADTFPTVLNDTLKALKDKFVKMPKHNQKHKHEDFARLLAMLFIQSQCWSQSICKAIQNYALNTLDRWVIFNKKRQQDQDAAINTELIYLESVNVFIQQTRSILSDQFPEQIHFWLDEIKEKLLHDLTHRSVRVVLLDILLNNAVGAGNSALFKPHRCSASVATQTGSGSGRGTPDIFQRTSQGPLYKAPRGTLYPRRDPFTPHDFQENSSKVSELFGCLNDFKSPFDVNSQNSSAETKAVSMTYPCSTTQETPQSYPINSTTDEARSDLFSGYHHPDVEKIDEVVKEPDALALQAVETSELVNVYSDFSNISSQVSPQTTQSSERGGDCEPGRSETPVKRISYTSEELKAMNPMKGLRMTASQLKEPFELQHIFCRMDDGALFSEEKNLPLSNPSHMACQQYTGDVSAPKELSLLDSNCEAYTPNSCDDNLSKNSFSCFNLNDNAAYKDSNLSTHEQSSNSRKMSFEVEDWTHGITLEADDLSNSGGLKELASTDKAEDCEAVNTKWPDNFFRNSAAGKKKKKTKFRPLDEVLDEGKSFGVDEAEQDFDELDEFSDAAMQMYLELEKDGEERKFQEARMIHGPRLISSSKPKASLFADARKGIDTFKSAPWVPGKRKCTRCGSENHIVNDCTEGTINNMEDMSYMF